MAMNFNSHNFEEIYKELGINLDDLGCIMLDLKATGIPQFPDPSSLYYAKDPKKFWIKGFVAATTPHITLLYGLLKSGKEWEEYVSKVLRDWEIATVTIKEVSFFESPYKNEPYYCVVAHIDLTENLLEGHYRLSLLPHINTFPAYKAHFTIAYIKKDELIKNLTISYYNEALRGKELAVIGVNLGGKK